MLIRLDMLLLLLLKRMRRCLAMLHQGALAERHTVAASEVAVLQAASVGPMAFMSSRTLRGPGAEARNPLQLVRRLRFSTVLCVHRGSAVIAAGGGAAQLGVHGEARGQRRQLRRPRRPTGLLQSRSWGHGIRAHPRRRCLSVRVTQRRSCGGSCCSSEGRGNSSSRGQMQWRGACCISRPQPSPSSKQEGEYAKCRLGVMIICGRLGHLVQCCASPCVCHLHVCAALQQCHDQVEVQAGTCASEPPPQLLLQFILQLKGPSTQIHIGFGATLHRLPQIRVPPCEVHRARPGHRQLTVTAGGQAAEMPPGTAHWAVRPRELL
mmetsp:Transcript_14298/g.43205  ORF Transcript_14298/g.43205 Transcript_14298/m.43205 type:complete len:322 (-) Transcript_14298:506-1471(-)